MTNAVRVDTFSLKVWGVIGMDLGGGLGRVTVASVAADLPAVSA